MDIMHKGPGVGPTGPTPWEVDRRFVAERQWNEKQLRELHQEILRLLVLGWQPGAIAQELGIHPQTVSNVRNSPLARERLASLGGLRDEKIVEITERVREFAPVALAVLEEIIKGEREAPIALQARTAENYLSRAGHGTIQKNIVAHGHLSRSDIEDIKERARSAARACGVMVSEAEYTSSVSGGASPLSTFGATSETGKASASPLSTSPLGTRSYDGKGSEGGGASPLTNEFNEFSASPLTSLASGEASAARSASSRSASSRSADEG